MSNAALTAIRERTVEKGDVLAAARVAAILGAKKTPDLVPLCHPIGLSGVEVDLSTGSVGVDIKVTVKTVDRTGVEMEALTAVSVAALAIVDMVKGLDRATSIENVRIVAKEGGRSGAWVRPGELDADAAGSPRA
jgi:cyclic pyranopterin phosphate synthase